MSKKSPPDPAPPNDSNKALAPPADCGQRSERCARQFLESRGLRVEKIPTNPAANCPTPDFAVSLGQARVACCEVKSRCPEQSEQILTSLWQEPGKMGASHRGNLNLVSLFHSAAKQLQAYNPAHHLANWLVVVVWAGDSDLVDLHQALTGGSCCPRRFGRTNPDLTTIDLVIWLDQREPEAGFWLVNENPDQQAVLEQSFPELCQGELDQ